MLSQGKVLGLVLVFHLFAACMHLYRGGSEPGSYAHTRLETRTKESQSFARLIVANESKS